MDKEKKLEDLFTDDALLNEAEIAGAIHPFIAIQRDTKKIFIKDTKSTHAQKIIAFALAKKLLASKDKNYPEKITSSEILKELNLKRGTVDGEFGKFRKNGIFFGEKGNDGYEIPMYKITDALNIINKNK